MKTWCSGQRPSELWRTCLVNINFYTHVYVGKMKVGQVCWHWCCLLSSFCVLTHLPAVEGFSGFDASAVCKPLWKQQRIIWRTMIISLVGCMCIYLIGSLLNQSICIHTDGWTVKLLVYTVCCAGCDIHYWKYYTRSDSAIRTHYQTWDRRHIICRLVSYNFTVLHWWLHISANQLFRRDVMV